MNSCCRGRREKGKGVRGELRAVRVSDDLLSVLVQLAVAAATVSVRVSVTSLRQSGSWATYPSPPPPPLYSTPCHCCSLLSHSLFKHTHNFRHLKAKVVAQIKKERKKQRSHKVKVVKDNTKLEQQVERQHTHTHTHTGTANLAALVLRFTFYVRQRYTHCNVSFASLH